MIRKSWVQFLFRLLVGGVFIWAGALKVAQAASEIGTGTQVHHSECP